LLCGASHQKADFRFEWPISHEIVRRRPRVALPAFKTKIDGINKRNDFWGFKGIKGQMFFNMMMNVAQDLDACDKHLKRAIVLPTSEDQAGARIEALSGFVTELGEEFVKDGGSKMGRPKIGSIPFFLSFFWQVQDRFKWPAGPPCP